MLTELPYVAGSDTSRTAAERSRRVAPKHRALVLHLIESRGADGATDEEIENVLGLKHQTVSARRNDLANLGVVRDSGQRRPTESGCPATVWVLGPGYEPPGHGPAELERPSPAELLHVVEAHLAGCDDPVCQRVGGWLEKLAELFSSQAAAERPACLEPAQSWVDEGEGDEVMRSDDEENT